MKQKPTSQKAVYFDIQPLRGTQYQVVNHTGEVLFVGVYPRCVQFVKRKLKETCTSK